MIGDKIWFSELSVIGRGSPRVEDNMIYWDSTRALILSDGKSVQSPALQLVHEMGHAGQGLIGVYIQYEDGKITKDQIEEANTNYINHIEKELGEYIRNGYHDSKGGYDVSTSTD